MREVQAGGRAISPELAAEAWYERDPLTDRERQVWGWPERVCREPASRRSCVCPEGTVRNYLSEAINKLGASNRLKQRVSPASGAGSEGAGLACAPGPDTRCAGSVIASHS